MTFDVFVALFWTAFSFANEEIWVETERLWYVIPFTLFMGVSLFWRRRWPVEVFGFYAVMIIVMTIIDADDQIPPSLMCAVYSLAAWSYDRRKNIAAFVGFVTIAIFVVLVTDLSVLGDAAVVILLLAVSWLIGDRRRNRRALQLSLIERAERAEALQASEAAKAVAEERTRIARDLHDVVAHSMSLMVVQAAAARRVLGADPEAASKALEAIENTGRNSLGEMRRILDVLRSDAENPETAPAPDIAAIDGLANEFASAGLVVDLTHEGDPRPLSASLELTAYRIVQESLTNSLKHSGAAQAQVTLTWGEHTLTITVIDEGVVSAATSSAPGSGRGLVGMRERVAAFGGSFETRARLGGGWTVTASLPTDANDAKPPEERPGASHAPDEAAFAAYLAPGAMTVMDTPS